MCFIVNSTKIFKGKDLKMTPCNWQSTKPVVIPYSTDLKRSHVARDKEGHCPLTEDFLMKLAKCLFSFFKSYFSFI